MQRASGILMPIFSLPSPYGIGCFGKAAYAFADFLHEAGQSCWQMLPLGPTSYGDSPYQSFSTHAGNPYFIDLETLIADGLLRGGEAALAGEIARRFCDTCAASGFAENFNAVTGAPLRDPAYTWTSSVFLTLAREFLAEKHDNSR